MQNDNIWCFIDKRGRPRYFIRSVDGQVEECTEQEAGVVFVPRYTQHNAQDDKLIFPGKISFWYALASLLPINRYIWLHSFFRHPFYQIVSLSMTSSYLKTKNVLIWRLPLTWIRVVLVSFVSFSFGVVSSVSTYFDYVSIRLSIWISMRPVSCFCLMLPTICFLV